MAQNFANQVRLPGLIGFRLAALVWATAFSNACGQTEVGRDPDFPVLPDDGARGADSRLTPTDTGADLLDLTNDLARVVPKDANFDAASSDGGNDAGGSFDILLLSDGNTDVAPSTCTPWGHWEIEAICSDLWVYADALGEVVAACMDAFTVPECECPLDDVAHYATPTITAPCTLNATIIRSAFNDVECDVVLVNVRLEIVEDAGTAFVSGYNASNPCEFHALQDFTVRARRIPARSDSGSN